MTALCIAGAGLAVQLAASAFTLSWTHTIEKTRWEEDWRIGPHSLVLVEARVKGSGAGMEPPAGARLRGGFYVWRPELEREEVVLRRDPHAGDWRLCAGGECATIGTWLGRDADPVTLHPAAEDGCKKPAATR